MFKKQNYNDSIESELESPWISFTDLMAGFLVVILLALAAAIIMLTLEKNSLQKQRENVEIQLADTQKSKQQAETALSEAIAKAAEAKKILSNATSAELKANLAKQNAIQISLDFIKLFEELRASQLGIDKTVKLMENYDTSRLNLLTSIKQNLANRNIVVNISTSGEVMHISEDNLSFDIGKHDVASQFQQTMKSIGDEVAKGLTSPNGKIIDTVFVEGHTDNLPNSKKMGNWGLSSYRAISVWKFWSESPGQAGLLSKLKNADNKAMFSVTGYGETRPLRQFKLGTEKDQRVNRRIDLRFNLQSAKKDLLIDLSQEVSKSVEKFDLIFEKLKSRLKTLTKDDAE